MWITPTKSSKPPIWRSGDLEQSLLPSPIRRGFGGENGEDVIAKKTYSYLYNRNNR